MKGGSIITLALLMSFFSFKTINNTIKIKNGHPEKGAVTSSGH